MAKVVNGWRSLLLRYMRLAGRFELGKSTRCDRFFEAGCAIVKKVFAAIFNS